MEVSATRRAAVALLLVVAVDGQADFTCDGGSKTIPRSFVSDDYCDCADGSDEETTGACPDKLFTCPNRPSRPSQIFVSRVNDGICDCCDGSDEWRRPTLCADSCLDSARASLAVFERACKRKDELSREGMEAAARRKQRLEQAHAELQAAEPTKQALEAAKVAAEMQESAKRADRERRIADGEISRALRLERLTSPMLAQALARLALAQGVPGVDKLHDFLSGHEATSALMGDVDSADLLELAMDARDTDTSEAAADGATQQSSSGAGAGAGDGETRTCAAHEACGFERPLIELLPLGTLAEPTLRALLSGFNELTSQTGLLARVSQELLSGAGEQLDGAAVAAALELLDEFRDADADAARAAHAAHAASSDAARKAIGDETPAARLEAAFGPAHEWAHLHGRCFELKTDLAVGKFTFKLCPFGRFTQDSNLLGTYEGWAPMPNGVADEARKRDQLIFEREVMAFGGGDPCDGTPRRALVYFECGEHDALLSVVEPATCVYAAWFATPSACDAEELRRRHEALTAMAA